MLSRSKSKIKRNISGDKSYQTFLIMILQLMITSLLALPLQFINASSSEYGNEKIDQLLFDIVQDYKEAIKGNITLSMRKFSTSLNVSRIFFSSLFKSHYLIMGKI